MRRAVALWVILAVAVCVKIVWRGGDRLVYPVFAASSHHWWADRPLYAPYGPTEVIDSFRYAPTFAVAFTPLAYLPDRLGAIVWSLAGIGLLFWALQALMRDVLPPPSVEEKGWSPWHQRMFLTLTLGGSAVGIWSGQSNALVLALIALGLAAIARQRWGTASFLLAVPVLIKLWPLAIVLLLIVYWPRQLTWRLAVVCAVLALIPFLTRHASIVAWQYHGWYESLTGPLQARNDGYRDAWTFWEQLCPLVHCRANWEGTVSRVVYTTIQLAAALAVLGWCLWQFPRRRVDRQERPACNEGDSTSDTNRRLLTLIFATWAAWQLLFGPATEQLTYGIIAPAAAWAVLVSFAEKKARWLTLAAWTLLALMPSGDIERAVLRVFPAGKILLPFGVVLFVVWLAWHEHAASNRDCGTRLPSPIQTLP